ncbi:MAG: hypothetical protein OXB84_05185, partial [Halobacteriovoraceae bacterium]|nr:hypothetical protein [Halobacteriovoraceae bacterium]
MKTLFFCLFILPPAFAGILEELTESEKALLTKGPIVKEKENKNSSWPIITMYILVDASPLETVALFAAYDHQKNYVPNIVVSVPVKQVNPTEIWCRYEYKTPWPLSNSHYVHAHRLSKNQNGFRVEWRAIESDAMDRVSGAADFQPFEGKTLFKYHNEVEPKS